jgi:KaiC/GvpD/RAD55 family RecA-like ATPase
VHSGYNNRPDFGKFVDVEVEMQEEKAPSPKPGTQMVCSVYELVDRNNREPKHNFIWNGIKESSFGYIYGPPKVGKTIFAENLGLSIAAGYNSFLGIEIDQTKKRTVLFIGMEEFWRNRAERNQKQLEAMEAIDKSKLPYLVVNEDFPGRLRTKEDWGKIDQIIQFHNPDVVFIDSMTRTICGEIEDSSTSRDASFNLRELVKNYKITLVMIHHTTKLHGDPLDIDKLAGSRVIAQEADFLYGIYRTDNTHYIKEVACRYKQESETLMVFSINDHLWVDKIGEKTDGNDETVFTDGRANPAKDQFILDTIQSLIISPEQIIETSKVWEIVKVDVGRTEFYRRLEKLGKAGKIRHTRGSISIL